MDLVDSLYARLRGTVDREPGGAAAAALTVADIYQRLVPYRAVRGELSILELAEYEHALLRLLSGERGYMEIADAAREELCRELSSPNPILGIYRDYAGAPVRLVAGPPAGADPAPRPRADVTEEAPPAPRPRPGSMPAGGGAHRPPAPHAPVPASDETSPLPDRVGGEPLPGRGGVVPFDACIRCGEPLPDDADLRFCPGCGADQRQVPCVRCGAPLKPEWNFCVRCGNPRDAAPPAV